MGSSLDLLGSYIIGGIVIILMGAVILNFQEGAQQATLNEISQVTMAEMSQTMEKELVNLGYRVPGNKIVSIDYRSITFLSDYDNDGTVDTISYMMGKGASGPVITRRIATPGQRPMEWTTRGSMVLFSGYDSTGTQTSVASRVRAVEASMLTSNVLFEKISDANAQTSTLLSGDLDGKQLTVSHDRLLTTAVDCEAGAYWHKVIYPRNLGTVAPQIAGATPSSSTGSSTDEGDTDDGGYTYPGDTGDTGDTGDAGDTGGTVDAGDTGGSEDDSDILPTKDPCDPPPGKNDPCCCGSGLKYKQCCGK
ncbi:SEC-C domain-containing protein [bacterium]|nr:SEC-C domain-containing protein [bacterium]